MNRMKQTQGFALVMTLLIVAIVSTLVTGSLLLAITNRQISSNDARSTQALNVAQAGNAYWKAELVSLYRHMLENIGDYEDEISAYVASGGNISCGNYLAIGADLNRDGTIATASGDVQPDPEMGTLPAITIPLGNVDGEANVTFDVDGSAVVLRSRSSFAGARATVVEAFSLRQLDMWNNAVSAEVSAPSTSISGRATIRGSVHVLGVGLASTATALNISGNLSLGNTYKGLSTSIDTTALRLTTPDPTDLCAELRVKNGKVLMDGNSRLGYAESTNTLNDKGEEYIDNVRGIYTDNGNGIVGGTEGGNVHSENGMTAGYDAGASLDFPELNDDIPDPDSGTSGATIKRWEHIFNNALVLSTAASDPNFMDQTLSRDDRISLPRLDNAGNLINIPAGYVQQPGATYLSASCVTTALFGIKLDGTSTSSDPNFQLVYDSTASPSFHCIKYRMEGSTPAPITDKVVTEVIWSGKVGLPSHVTSGDTVTFSPNQLYVGGAGGGVVFWGGDLTIKGGGGSDPRITYRGDGVLFAETRDHDGISVGGNINLEINFLPSSTPTDCASLACAYRPKADTGRLEKTTRVNTYPATALVGLVARKNVSSGGSQQRFTAAIYAEKSVAVAQQTVVAGAIVTKSFDAGSNVPTVLYVPNLAQYLSELMPGAGGTSFAVSNVAWNRQ